MGYDIEDGIPEQELDLVKKHSIKPPWIRIK
jgi:hypothetical protein